MILQDGLNLTDELNCTGIIRIKEFSRVQVRFLMLNAICLTSLQNIQQYLILPVFLIVDANGFLLAFETNLTKFRHKRLIYVSTNQMIIHKLMRIKQNCYDKVPFNLITLNILSKLKHLGESIPSFRVASNTFHFI